MQRLICGRLIACQLGLDETLGNLRDQETVLVKQGNNFSIRLSVFEKELGDPLAMRIENILNRELDALKFHVAAR